MKKLTLPTHLRLTQEMNKWSDVQMKQLLNFANADLKDARKNGEIALINTKRGTMKIGYANKKYSVEFCHTGSKTIGLTATEARISIIENYSISK